MASASAPKKEIMRITASSRNARIIDEARNLRKTRREARILHCLNGYSAEGPIKVAAPVSAPDIVRWEVGGGQAPRQPGQVRKEAAVTSSGLGRCSVSHLILSRRNGCNDGSRDRLSRPRPQIPAANLC